MCDELTSVLFIYLMVFIVVFFFFCTFLLWQMSFYLRRTSRRITLELTAGAFVRIHVPSAQLPRSESLSCCHDSSTPGFLNPFLFCLRRVLEGRGRAGASQLPCQQANLPARLRASSLQFAPRRRRASAIRSLPALR